MRTVLIRENVTAGASGRMDKGTEKRLEMMWCQHGCHSCKEQEVYNAVRTTQLHTVQQRPLTLHLTLNNQGHHCFFMLTNRFIFCTQIFEENQIRDSLEHAHTHHFGRHGIPT